MERHGTARLEVNIYNGRPAYGSTGIALPPATPSQHTLQSSCLKEGSSLPAICEWLCVCVRVLVHQVLDGCVPGWSGGNDLAIGSAVCWLTNRSTSACHNKIMLGV